MARRIKVVTRSFSSRPFIGTGVFLWISLKGARIRMIELKDVSVRYQTKDRDFYAVKNVNLEVKAGEIYGIVGYSGAGKSTLVRTINLLQRPSQGQVIVRGQDMLALPANELSQARKKIGMIFQHFNLMESRTIADNVAFPLKGSGLSKSEKQAKVQGLLELVGLGDKAKAYPQQLSGGQKQRVAIARALANDPDVLLCDEATSALDPKTTQSILDLLRELNLKRSLTMVIITHEMAVVKDLCHRVAVMEAGEIIEQGSIVQIFTQPARPLTQEFIHTATRFDHEIHTVVHRVMKDPVYVKQTLAKISYVGDDTIQPLVGQLVRNFQVMVNILYGNIEVLQGTPVGNLLVSIDGEPSEIDRCLTSLRDQVVRVDLVDVKAYEEVNDNGKELD